MRLRKYLDITKESVDSFKERADLHRVTVYKYMRGKVMPRLKELVKIEEQTNGAVMPNDFLEHYKEIEAKKKS